MCRARLRAQPRRQTLRHGRAWKEQRRDAGAKGAWGLIEAQAPAGQRARGEAGPGTFCGDLQHVSDGGRAGLREALQPRPAQSCPGDTLGGLARGGGQSVWGSSMGQTERTGRSVKRHFPGQRQEARENLAQISEGGNAEGGDRGEAPDEKSGASGWAGDGAASLGRRGSGGP